jgi:hypothetical protein
LGATAKKVAWTSSKPHKFPKANLNVYIIEVACAVCQLAYVADASAGGCSSATQCAGESRPAGRTAGGVAIITRACGDSGRRRRAPWIISRRRTPCHRCCCTRPRPRLHPPIGLTSTALMDLTASLAGGISAHIRRKLIHRAVSALRRASGSSTRQAGTSWMGYAPHPGRERRAAPPTAQGWHLLLASTGLGYPLLER